MPHVYVFNEGGKTEPMSRVHCKDEIRELQDILDSNYDLLPGDQIDPDDPCRWLLIKREMPVPDPATGANRWSIDFFFADQSGMPTFVECKRFEDTRSRREVIGQMLEYAANGPEFWDMGLIRQYAEASARHSKSTIEDSLRALQPNEEVSVESFFERVTNNLREGQLRIIFFLEEAPNELKRLVVFLNKQMVSSEVLLVEAQQYVRDGIRVVVPALFGFTEQARQVKKTVTVKSRESKGEPWNEGRFFDEARSKLEHSEFDAVQRLYEFSKSLADDIRWGTGTTIGSFSPIFGKVSSKSLYTVWTGGALSLNFLDPLDSDAGKRRIEFKQLLETSLGVRLPDVSRQGQQPSFRVSEWYKKEKDVEDVVKELTHGKDAEARAHGA